MKLRFALACLVFAGCAGTTSTPILTNDQIIAEVKKCDAAGMDARIFYNWADTPMRVDCLIRDKKKCAE